MKANELSLNDLNYHKLEEHFKNENKFQNENESDDPCKNENGFETVVTFENEIKIPNETRNGNETGFGFGNENRNGNELQCGNENQFRNENENELGNELIQQMNNEILFCSTHPFNTSEQTIPNPRLPKNHIQVIKIGRTNIVEIWQRYYTIVKYFLYKEYLTPSEVIDFELATSRFDKINKIYKYYNKSEHIEQAVAHWEDKIKETETKHHKWHDNIDLFDVNLFILLLIPILILVLAITRNI